MFRLLGCLGAQTARWLRAVIATARAANLVAIPIRTIREMKTVAAQSSFLGVDVLNAFVDLVVVHEKKQNEIGNGKISPASCIYTLYILYIIMLLHSPHSLLLVFRMLYSSTLYIYPTRPLFSLFHFEHQPASLCGNPTLSLSLFDATLCSAQFDANTITARLGDISIPSLLHWSLSLSSLLTLFLSFVSISSLSIYLLLSFFLSSSSILYQSPILLAFSRYNMFLSFFFESRPPNHTPPFHTNILNSHTQVFIFVSFEK